MEDTVAFPTQEYLRERSTMLHYAYLAYIVKKKITHYSHSHYNECVRCVY